MPYVCGCLVGYGFQPKLIKRVYYTEVIFWHMPKTHKGRLRSETQKDNGIATDKDSSQQAYMTNM